MVDITSIMTAIIQLIFVVILTFFIPWIKTKVSNENLIKAKSLIKIGVQAAEMIFGAGMGTVKKQYVEEFILPEFAKANLTFDADTINNMIESAVLELDAKI